MRKVPIWHLRFFMGGPTYGDEEFVAAYSAEEAMEFVRKTHVAYTPCFQLVEQLKIEVSAIEPSNVGKR